jgi:hypothetical protein
VTLFWSHPRYDLTSFKSVFFVCLFHLCTHYLSLSSFPLPTFLPHFPLWCVDPLLGQRASSWSRSLYFHSIITWTAVFLTHILIIWHISFLLR